MSAEERALLDGILDAPDCDTARLVYADWLQEHDLVDRAEFIRVQVQLASWNCTFKQTKEQPGWKHNCGTDGNGYWLCQPLRSHERELFGNPRNFVNWTPAVMHTGSGAGIRMSEDEDTTVELTGKGFQSVTFRRGFASEIRLTCAAFLEYAADIFCAHPITSVVLSDRAPEHHDERSPEVWAWWHMPAPTWQAYEDHNVLPTEIWELVECPDNAKGVLHRRKEFNSGDAAIAALNRACVSYGRWERAKRRCRTAQAPI